MPTASSSAERRAFPRIPLLSEVWIVDADGQRVHVRTRDLSRGGLCIEVDGTPWRRGELLDLRLRLPDSSAELELRGVVAWTRTRLTGISFDSIRVQDAALIEATIARVLEELESLESERTPTS